ncbi:OmpA family protein [Aureibacter tunicatorum]|uniref:Nitrate reductase NapE component n=1 Tax=Aureibacter tunicatorum TaxID=866807 RepID=A0AAE3XNP7_9BACT|nr:OmpA family protein [Aureibacter tunicatorum]MDR6239928.1 nitrate reductase NapE component [Aureibacter tunicatorum]BDD04403.1 hypothetical protein AUTU_18860 [Aureibacter tunicatorum]
MNSDINKITVAKNRINLSTFLLTTSIVLFILNINFSIHSNELNKFIYIILSILLLLPCFYFYLSINNKINKNGSQGFWHQAIGHRDVIFLITFLFFSFVLFTYLAFSQNSEKTQENTSFTTIEFSLINIVACILILSFFIFIILKQKTSIAIASLISGCSLLAIEQLTLNLTLRNTTEYKQKVSNDLNSYKPKFLTEIKHFKSGEYFLTNQMKGDLIKYKESLVNSSAILLIGSADKRQLTGKLKYKIGSNFELSTLRAISVKNYLITNTDINEDKIIILSKGGIESDTNRLYNDRSVEIYIM